MFSSCFLCKHKYKGRRKPNLDQHRVGQPKIFSCLLFLWKKRMKENVGQQIRKYELNLHVNQFYNFFFRLLLAEQAGKLCRDDSLEGLRFYPNKFLVIES